ncbi:MAG: hypothetical protein WD182_01825, partial [Bacteroidota bacterium]
MIRTYVKIGLTWAVAAAVVYGITNALPHRDFKTLGVLAGAFDLLVAVCCFFVAAKEIGKSTRVLFSFIGIFFLFIALGWSVGALVGRAFLRDDPFAHVYWVQYEWAIYFFMLLFVIVFGALELVTRKPKILRRSFLSLLIAGIPFLFLYYPYFLNPKYQYTVPEVSDLLDVREAVSHSQKMGGGIPDIDRLANDVDLLGQDGPQTFEQKYQRVARIFPYLEGKNYILLIYKPTYLNALYMSMIGLAVLLAMLGYCYRNDWPKSAYLEKVLIAFVPVCVLECVHAYSFSILTDFQVFQEIFNVGTILTRISYAFVLFFLVLR